MTNAAGQKPFSTRIKDEAPSRYGAMVWDDKIAGLGCRVFQSKREYVFRYRTKPVRDEHGNLLRPPVQRVVRLGLYGSMTVEQARSRAGALHERVRKGSDPVAEDEAARAASHAAQKARDDRRTVAQVLDDFMARYVQRSALRSAREYESAFKRLVKPMIGGVSVHDLRRSQVAAMLDRIEDENGAVMADRTLAYLRKALNWEATRDDTFASPIVKGMARTKPKERARDRVLSDDEIRTIWPHLTGTWGTFVKMLLLTAQRRSEVAHMQRGEITTDGVWTIPAERYKTKRANVVPLSQAALDLIAAQPKREDCAYVFPSRDGTPIPASGKPKAKLDAAVTRANGGPLAPWTLHDLRRTARSLMARTGVSSHVAERVLGHVIAGVEGVYDRHDYEAEKRAALAALAREIDRVLNLSAAKVVALRHA